MNRSSVTPVSPEPHPAAVRRPSWADTLRAYLEPASLRMFALGFSAGLPLLLVLGTLSFRLREAGLDRTTIGYLSWVGLAYGFKWVWSPLVDRLPIPLLTRAMGRRRSWLLLSQLAIMGALAGMAFADPRSHLDTVVWCALAVAFASATQDIALDAYRIESADAAHQGALAATYQTGYRLAMIWAGAGVLWLAARAEVAPVAQAAAAVAEAVKPAPGALYQNGAWTTAYLVMAASMLVGVVTVLFSREPAQVELPPSRNAGEWFKGAFVEPFADFLKRYGTHAVLILALIGVYRISDVVMGIMANPFYVDMGYTKDEVAAVTKVYGVIMTLVGAFVGGALSLRLGVMRVLMLGAILSAASNLLFAWLAGHGHDVTALIAVVSADNLSAGVASAAFIAYLSSLTNVSYSATQYALFSSMMLLAPKWLAGYSGAFVDAYDYPTFFTATAFLGLPVLVLIWLATRISSAPAFPAKS
ncbi:AmpG family muropeptide MFS transporter [Hydrogenophaga pseudoflava]|uniref:AmpG family muropeptide MFS transporter n=1 Tax=Hydrogenophaga pseudoflava TaxID=47421 RepID=UPI0027E3E832|nr:AmpG family muropeptide MFS transporter [Hydrogenophaga pseudoflava]MDQ7745966.1 AmpG family muropeptide MFS transporter [Hydrogenophaga pseudoflava]